MAAWLERESLVLAGQEVVASVAEKALARTLQAALNSGKDWPLFVPVDTTFQVRTLYV